MRPLSLGNVRAQLHQMLQQRAGFYASVADLHLTVEGRRASEIVDEIQEWEAHR
jgi:adhesin HecA-like repeat protein